MTKEQIIKAQKYQELINRIERELSALEQPQYISICFINSSPTARRAGLTEIYIDKEMFGSEMEALRDLVVCRYKRELEELKDELLLI